MTITLSLIIQRFLRLLKSTYRRMTVMLSPFIPSLSTTPQSPTQQISRHSQDLKGSPTRKRARHVVEPVYPRTMEEFTAELESAFEEPLAIEKLVRYSEELQQEYRARLKDSNISMLPSYNHTLPSGSEMGDFLALDVGGSTFRIALVRLAGRGAKAGAIEMRRIKTFAIDEKVKRLKGQAFFDWMAERIGIMLAEYRRINEHNRTLNMGLAWSFPVEQTSPTSGKLLAMGKGFLATEGLEGQDLSEIIMRSCRARKLDVELRAIVNDGAATLLSQAYSDSSARVSLILGTGMNAAIFLPVNILGEDKFGTRPESWHAIANHVLINTELSMFGKGVVPVTPWDELLNSRHILPDFQPMEYLVTGMYLGEIVRLILLEAIEDIGLFGGEIPKRLDENYSLDTRTIAAFENDTTPDLSIAAAHFVKQHGLRNKPSQADLKFVQTATKLVSRRAQAYLATAVHALCMLKDSCEISATDKMQNVTVACNGAVIDKYPSFRSNCQRYLDTLCMRTGGEAGSITLEMAPESSIFGAAVAVSCIQDT